jgi:drug/metabolite transporter (DMT)-like permease
VVSLAGRGAGLPAATRGALWMIAAAVGFSGVVIFVREATADLHPFVVAFWRSVFGFAFMLPWVLHRPGGAGRGQSGSLGDRLARFRDGLRLRRQGWFLLRALFAIIAMLSWFTALSRMPMAEAVALSFTTPLFATIGAALILREQVRARRWTATLVGFGGVLVILRPGAAVVDPAALLVLLSAVAIAFSMMVIKVISRTETSGTIVSYSVFYLIVLSALPALSVWHWPDGRGFALLIAAGAAGTFGHLTFTQALKTAEASAIVPFDYVRLPLAALAGYWLYGEIMDAWSWVGAAIIVAAAIYIARREAAVARQRHAATAPDRPPAAAEERL